MIFCRTKRAAERVLASIIKYIEEVLYQKVNREKTVVAHIKDVKFLGYGFYFNKKRLLAYCRKPYFAQEHYQRTAEASRLHLLPGLLQNCSPCKLRNSPIPNGMYGGVRGRKIKLGGKLFYFPLTRFSYSFLNASTILNLWS